MRIISVILFVILCQSVVSQSFDRWFENSVLRFDYYRSGDKHSEFISEDAVYREGKWAGSKLNLIDTFGYGNYFFEVYDSASSTLIYSRGYSSLFIEWRFTDEAERIKRTFSETVIFPFPKSTILLKFYQRSSKGEWISQYSTYINPNDYQIITQPALSIKSFKIFGNKTSENALDIVLLAEGYTEAEMQKFMNDAQRFVRYLTECEPFSTHKENLNIWAVPCVSMESGTDNPGISQWKNTIFDSHFYTFGTERYLNTLNNKMVRNAAANAPYDQIYILVNTNKYGGAGIYNYYSICTADNPRSDFVFVHEFGHAMAALGDEYYTSDVAVEGLYPADVEPWEPNLTTLVDFDSKWKNMVAENIPIPTPDSAIYHKSVGVFEGGGYLEKGVYRPVFDCTMKSAKYNNFCPVCSKAIVEMIEFYSH